jgi:hypothetical protein
MGVRIPLPAGRCKWRGFAGAAACKPALPMPLALLMSAEPLQSSLRALQKNPKKISKSY